METFRKYLKAFGVVAVTVLTFAVSLATNGITDQEWVLIAGTGASAIGVAIVPNLDAGIGAIAKTVLAFIAAGLAVLYNVVLGGLTPTEWIEVLVAGLAAVGVTALPNTWPPAVIPPVAPAPGGSSAAGGFVPDPRA